MTFDIDKVFTALNADKLRPGDVVITANDYSELVRLVKAGYPNGQILWIDRFSADKNFVTTAKSRFDYAYYICSTGKTLADEVEAAKNAVKMPDKNQSPKFSMLS
mgnify:CR=1 FL=1